ncbi:hypothetical protein QUF80_06645 [Desulfococcaceae bacterium HSG8]|nr:hypothetical protein [Desulfococcaceae bacterium HSG8]
MTRENSSKDIAAFNEKSLNRLIRTIRLSEGDFSLVLAHCNYTGLRRKMLNQLRTLSPSDIREIDLPDSIPTIYTFLRELLKDECPDAASVSGLEAVTAIDDVLAAANQVREEFGKNFPFPMILWVNDTVLEKFVRIAPDFRSWAGSSVRFRPENSDLSDALQQHADKWFGEIRELGEQGDDGLEFFLESFSEDAGDREPDLEPEHRANLLFLRGREAQNRGEWDSAISFYQESFSSWEQSDDRERKGVLQCFIAECYEQEGLLENAESYFQACIENFGACEARLASSVRDWCRILRKLEKWEELGKAAEKFSQSDYLALARARQGTDDPQKIIENLEAEREKEISESDPELGIGILDALHHLYFDQGNYLKAFRVKLEKYSLEHQYGFRAFIGAGRLGASRRRFQRGKTDVAREIRASGRQNDVNRLVSMLKEERCKLVVIHGASGVGKSSILEAGLEPALKQSLVEFREILPVLTRNYTGWVKHLKEKLSEALSFSSPPFCKGGPGGISSSSQKQIPPNPPLQKGGTEQLLDELRKNEHRNLITVLIFDQFEEFFFANPGTDERREFYLFLRDCLNMSFVKVVLSLREDYLHYLLECERMADMSAISNDILNKKNRYALGNFTPEDAIAVVKSLTEQGHFHPEEGLIDRMVDGLTSEDGEVRPIELQIVGSQIESKGIHTSEALRPKAELVQAFLDEAVQDCGTENEDIARLILYLLTDEKLTRPLKTRAEIEYELRALVKGTGLEVGDKQLMLVLEILTFAGMTVLIPGQPEKYQLVHDYLTEPIREKTKPLLEKLDTDRKEREIQQRLAEEEDKRQLQQAERDRKRKQWQLKIAVGAGFAFAVVAAVAILFGIIAKNAAERANMNFLQAEKAKQEANENLLKAEKAKQRADKNFLQAKEAEQKATENLLQAKEAEQESRKNLLQANYNLAKIFEEKAGVALDNGLKSKNTGDFQQAWLYTLTALQQDIGDQKLPISLKRLVQPELQAGISSCIWQSSEETTGPVSSVVFSPDGKHIAAASSGTVYLWDAQTGKELIRFKGYSRSLAFSPDGTRIASASDDVRVWDAETGRELTILSAGSATSVAFSPDGTRIVSGSRDERVRIWDAETGRELNTFRGHSNDVTSVAFSPDGTRIASGAWDNTVRIWDAETGMELNTFRGHSETVTSVAFSPDGTRIASGAWDKTVRIWDAETGKELATFSGHSRGVYSVAFSPDGTRIASGSSDKTMRVWDAETGRELSIFTGDSGSVYSLAFSPDGARIASGSGELRMWDVETGRELTIFTGHSSQVYSLAFSPDGARIASGSGELLMWDVETGEELTTFTGHPRNFTGHQKDFYSVAVAFTPDGTLIAGNNGRVWDAETGKELTTLAEWCWENHRLVFSPDTTLIASRSPEVGVWDTESGMKLISYGESDFSDCLTFSQDGTRIASDYFDTVKVRYTGIYNELELTTIGSSSINSVAFSPDGTRIASGSIDNTVRVRDAETGKKLATFSGHSGDVCSVAFSPDGTRIASGSTDNTVRLWDMETGKKLTTFSGHSGDVCNIAFSPDGTRIASESSDETVRLWDTEMDDDPNRIISHSAYVWSVAFNPDGKKLAFGSTDNTIRLWDTETGTELIQFIGHSHDVVSIAFDGSGKKLVSGAYDKTVRLWNAETGEALIHFFGHLAPVKSVAFDPSGKRVVSGSKDKSVRVWDAETGKELIRFLGHSDVVNSVAFSPDGKTLASGSHDNTVRVWDAETGNELIRFFGHSDDVNSVAFSPDGKKLASGSDDKTARLWNTKTGKQLVSFTGHSSRVQSVAFSPDGACLASGSSDKMVQLWDIQTSKKLARFAGHSADVYSISFSPDGKKLASGSYDKTVRLWKVDDLLNAYLKHGKDSPLFQKICEVSFAVFPYRLEGITLVEGSRRYLPLRGKFQPWQVFARPRPAHKDPVEWMIENLPEEYKKD